MDKYQLPPENKILQKSSYKGIVRNVYEEEIEVSLFNNGNEETETFPLNAFKNKELQNGDSVLFNVWKLKTGKVDGYFEKTTEKKRYTNPKEVKEIQKYLKKRQIKRGLENLLNKYNLLRKN